MNKKKYLLLAIITTAILTFGLTYAYFTWQSEETAVRITVDGVPISYNAGEDITGNLLPTLTKEEGISKDITVKLTKDNYESYIVYYLKINELPDELKHASFKYEMYKNNVLNKSGNFSEVNVNDVIPISQSNALSNIEDTYTLYLWIDGNMENPIEMTGQTFSFTLYARAENEYTNTGSIISAPEGCETKTTIGTVNGVTQIIERVDCPTVVADGAETAGANMPQLFDGMIPIKWDDSNNIVKADVTNPTDNAWYNYGSKQWANAVMVTGTTRDAYMDAEVGTTITTSDILAYWVWIPRYSYQLFNVEFTSGTSPQQIEIVFESASTEKSEGTTNGEMLTHPAFSFGTETEGYTELEGIWVAKFEPSGTATTGNLTVLPGVASLRNITVGAMYTASQQFANTAYLTEAGINQVDAHMMKNTEWGAVAYLSHSIYGKNAEITINSNSSYYTGGGTGTSYITNVGMSTTGTVYGVYDMSGGSFEYVMGNYNKTTGSSGLTVTSINGKYVDIYTGTTVASSYLGDAVGETAGWYSDYTTFVASGGPWFLRGGYFNNSAIAGAFAFYYFTGAAHTHYSFRPLLTAK